MLRYAGDLSAELMRIADGSQHIVVEHPILSRFASGLFDHHQTRRLDSAWSRYVEYPRMVRRRRADIFHVLDQGYAHLIGVLDPDRTVVTCHDVIPLLAASGTISLRMSATLRWTFEWRMAKMAKARTVIAVSHATKATLERYTSVRADRIVVIPQGVNGIFVPHAENTPEMRESVSIDAGCAVVLQVAAHGRYKNTPAVLHALALLRLRLGRDVVLVRVGSPLYSDEAALASKLGILNAVRYVGRVDDATLARWYNAADVLVFPSVWEGFGWPPLEAMACGTPVVASNIPAITEVVGDAGLLVPPDDPDAVAHAVEGVLTDAALAASMRHKGLERARQFTWTETAARTLAVYDNVLR